VLDRLDRLAIVASAAQFADPPSWKVRADQVRAQGTTDPVTVNDLVREHFTG
jgi:hypothetical protein